LREKKSFKFAINAEFAKSLEMTSELYSSLYIHFPFCESKCHYCDFYSIGKERTTAADRNQFLQALTIESDLWSKNLAPEMDTIFLGGGTPSMTPAADMGTALAPLQLDQRVTENTEWTMEANPSSVTFTELKAYQSLGVNRISMGVQSLHDDLLKNLGRVHSRLEALRALDAIFSSGFENVSVDLLCGVPGQSLKDLEHALKTLSSFPITHLSCYLLTLPKHHRMYKQLPDEDTQLDHLLFIDQWMRGQGFEHYEISNYARPGRRARHNLNYWAGSSYLGLGPSAHSFSKDQGVRWKNFSSLIRYADFLGRREKPLEWSEKLTPTQKDLESWMLALRLDSGFPENWLTQESQRAKADQFENAGLLERHPVIPTHLRLTPKGFALSDQVISALA